ncbi:Lipoprotein signal peptidase [hydrothermal vent metagenome]|uniref:Lipoprotein signal peptidase n=1 Tax=hydrothermal vent metagenome TaxID=652676 RepID=A0A3B1BVW3_9ZZZZ
MSESNAKRPGWILPVATVIFLVASDQVSKWVVEATFPLGSSSIVIPGFFNLVHIQNKGAAFGFLSGIDSAWINRGFTATATLALFVIVFLYRSLGPNEKVAKVAMVLIGAGALGNLIDRIRLGSVTDFLLFYVGEYSWPAFNVADSCVTVGVTLLAYSIIFHHPKA